MLAGAAPRTKTRGAFDKLRPVSGGCSGGPRRGRDLAPPPWAARRLWSRRSAARRPFAGVGDPAAAVDPTTETEMTRPTHLTDSHRSTVEELVEINVDSSKGFQNAAENVDDPGLERVFRDMATLRRQHAEELARLIAMEDPMSSSFAGKMHRWWIDMKTSMSSDETRSVLEEAERGEDQIKGKYEKVLHDEPDHPLGAVIREQYAAVKTGHDRVRNLRDDYKRTH